jgi:hypothetical protein
MSQPMPAGWFSDPHGRAVQRYWNGASWTPYVIDSNGQQRVEGQTTPPPHSSPSASAGGNAIVIQNIVQPQPNPMLGNFPSTTNPQAKSMGVAVALTVLFGPFGLFYVSVLGGIVLSAITLLSAFFLGILTWPAAIIWAVIGVNQHNAALMLGMQSAQPIHAHPQHPGQQIAPPVSPQTSKTTSRPRIKLSPPGSRDGEPKDRA